MDNNRNQPIYANTGSGVFATINGLTYTLTRKDWPGTLTFEGEPLCSGFRYSLQYCEPVTHAQITGASNPNNIKIVSMTKSPVTDMEPAYTNIVSPAGGVEGRIDNILQPGMQAAKYFVKDHLGSTRMVVCKDNNNNWITHEAVGYTAYGEQYPLMSISDDGTRETFTGKEFDQEGEVSGVTEGINAYHFPVRTYDPALGCWQSPDEPGQYLGVSKSSQYWSTYSYVGGNPISYYDANGSWGALMHVAASDFDEVWVDYAHFYSRWDVTQRSAAYNYFDPATQQEQQWSKYAHDYNKKDWAMFDPGSGTYVQAESIEEWVEYLYSLDVPEEYLRHLISDYYSYEGSGKYEMPLTLNQRILEIGLPDEVLEGWQDLDIDMFLQPLQHFQQSVFLRKEQNRILYEAGAMSNEKYESAQNREKAKATITSMAFILDPLGTMSHYRQWNIIQLLEGLFDKKK